MSEIALQLKSALGFENKITGYHRSTDDIVTGVLGLNIDSDNEEVAKYVDYLVDNPVEYISEMVNIRLYKYQIPFFHSIIKLILNKDETSKEDDTRSGLFTRQVGKNETIADAAIYLGTTHSNLFIGLFAPTEKQAKAVGLARIKTRLLSNPIFKSMIVTKNNDYIELSNGSSFRAFTANKNSQIEGFTLHLAFIDESQDINDHIYYHDIVPMLAGVNGSVVKIGTSGGRGHFFNTCKANEAMSKKNGERRHFQYDWKQVAKERPEYKKFVNSRLKELGGKDSKEFRSQFCNEWLFDERSFIDEEMANALIDNKFKPETEPKNGSVYFMGLKVVEGKGHTVLTVGNKDNGKINILNWYSWYGSDSKHQIQAIKELAVFWKVSGVFIFATEDDKFCKKLEKEGIPIVRVPNGGNSKSDVYKSFQIDIQCQDILIGKYQDLKERKAFYKQLLSLEQKWGENGDLQLEAPPDKQKDYVISTALLCWGGSDISELKLAESEKVKNEKAEYDLEIQQKRYFKCDKKTNWSKAWA